MDRLPLASSIRFSASEVGPALPTVRPYRRDYDGPAPRISWHRAWRCPSRVRTSITWSRGGSITCWIPATCSTQCELVSPAAGAQRSSREELLRFDRDFADLCKARLHPRETVSNPD